MIRVFLFALLVLPRLAPAECVHINWDDYRYVDDGPGTRGSLDGTMSLDCLTLIGVRQGEHRNIAYLRDDTGTIHTVVEGSSIGMPSGVVLGVFDDHLIIEKYKEVDGEWVPYKRTMTLSVENHIRRE
jgi:Tfp pilus assembly protein PilP